MIYMIQDDNQKEFSPEESKMDSPFAMFAQCISHIISLITPGNASKLSSTYPAFKSVVDSDSVWEKFLPSDYKKIISISSFSTSSLVTSLSKKKLYFHLCYNPILINNNTMSFALDHESGKKCYMVGARGLSITWGSSPQHWKWLSLPESRFPEVAELKLVWCFEIMARIETKILSSKTNYATYLVFKFVETREGFETRPIEFDVYFEGNDTHKMHSALLDPPANMPLLSLNRRDGWMEIGIGEFFNENGDDGAVICRVCESEPTPKCGIIIEGIELRPKNGR
ncbi:F-box protein PP2-B10 [Citrus sinensis]|uniref:F-box protein PP2-B10 n=1 Tax=Citrus sinensis TaxID=2711 RepID=A0ACB8KAB6_CITSI|nr:F-box protein PP2-B10 [Citrus sinensis]